MKVTLPAGALADVRTLGPESAAPAPAAAAAACAFFSFCSLMTLTHDSHSSHAGHCCPGHGLVSVQQISGFERRFAAKFEVVDAAVDGVDVHDTDGAGDRCDPVDQVFIGISDDDGWMIGTPVIGAEDQTFDVRLREFIDLFKEYLHFWGRGSAHDESDWLAVGPAVGLSFGDLDEIRQSDGANTVSFVRHQGKIARGRQRSAGREK